MTLTGNVAENIAHDNQGPLCIDNGKLNQWLWHSHWFSIILCTNTNNIIKLNDPYWMPGLDDKFKSLNVILWLFLLAKTESDVQLFYITSLMTDITLRF